MMFRSITVLLAVFAAPSFAGSATVAQFGPAEHLIRHAKQQGQYESLALLDLDADGRQDLALLAEDAKGTFLELYTQHTTGEFESYIARLDLPSEATLLAIGDLNGDGHPDILAGKPGARSLTVVPTIGLGQFDAPYLLELPTALRKLLVTDLGRRDLVPELVLALDDRLLVYSDGIGALMAKPRSYPLAATLTDMSATRFDGDTLLDLVIATDEGLAVLKGEDRWINSAEPAQLKFVSEEPLVAVTGLQGGGLVALGEDGGLHRFERSASAQKRPVVSQVGRIDPPKGHTQLLAARLASAHPSFVLVLDDHLELMSIDGAALARQSLPILPRNGLTITRLDGDAVDDFLFVDEQGVPRVVASKRRAVIQVNATDDIDDGVCGAIHCNLHEAIDAANANPGIDTIAFANLDVNDYTFSLTQALPEITDPVTLDGTTHPKGYIYIDGAAVPTQSPGIHVSAGSSTIAGLFLVNHPSHGIQVDTEGNNIIKSCRVGLREDNLSAGNMGSGIYVTSNNNLIGGTAASDFNVFSANFSHGIQVENADNNTFSYNWIGTKLDGLGSRGNSLDGFRVDQCTNSMIATPGNRISNRLTRGLYVTNSTGTLITGNSFGLTATESNAIGLELMDCTNVTVGGTSSIAANFFTYSTDPDETAFRVSGASSSGIVIIGNTFGDRNGVKGNQGSALHLEGVSGVMVGGANEAELNYFADNAQGIVITGSGTGNRIGQNSFFNNAGLAIDLGDDGVSADDAGDADTGPNLLQNRPMLTSALLEINEDVIVEYFVDSDPTNATYPLTVSIYEADSQSSGEGKTLLYVDTFQEADYNNGTRQVTIGTATALDIAYNDYLVGLATDANGNSSEFSLPNALELGGSETYVVNSTNDNDNGICNATHCSLREAINAANATELIPDTIIFDLPPGSVITPETALPAIVGPTTIDAAGMSDQPAVQLDGSNIPNLFGIQLRSDNCILKGFAFTNFWYPVYIQGNQNKVLRNYLGFDLDGNPAASGIRGIQVYGSNNQIGDVGHDGNVISGFDRGLHISSTNVLVLNNKIGTNIDGTAVVGNEDGIYASNSDNLVIGGLSPGMGNLISGNDGRGIYISTRDGQILGNTIGTDITGSYALSNGSGVYMQNVGDSVLRNNLISGNQFYGVYYSGNDAVIAGNIVGTDATGLNNLGNEIGIDVSGTRSIIGEPGEANVIAFNDIGLNIRGSTRNEAIYNSFFMNGIGIELNAGNNDPGDMDEGPNRGQNHPVIDQITIDGSGDLIATYFVDSDPSYSTYPIEVVFYEADTLQSGQGYQLFTIDSFGEADYLAGSRTVNLGNAAALGIDPLEPIVTLANDAEGNTSEFSNTLALPGDAQTFVVNTSDDINDGRCDATHCSLREAMEASETNVDRFDTITFDIPGSGPHVISLTAELPDLFDPLIIDGTTQAGYVDRPLIVLDGQGVIDEAFALRAFDSELTGVAFINFDEQGLFLGGRNVVIDGCWFGLSGDGLTEGPNEIGLLIGGNQNTIGSARGNYFAGNTTTDLRIAGDSNTIDHAVIGLDLSDQPHTTSDEGILITGVNNILKNSLISGPRTAVQLEGSNNQVLNCLVGTDSTGAASSGETSTGIYLGGTNNRVGDGTEAGRNVISGNQVGVYCWSQGQVLHNYIGLTSDGTMGLGNNLYGIDIGRLVQNGLIIDGNIISGNGEGIHLGLVNDISIEITNNSIGTDASGTNAVPNIDGVGVWSCTNITIGGIGQGNLISGNERNGVYFYNTTGVNLVGNRIGLDETGQLAIPNRANGIEIEDGNLIVIGGETAQHGNVISGNIRRGIYSHIEGEGTHTIRNNRIGTNVEGSSAVGNGMAGVAILDGNNQQIVDNLISGNGRGIYLASSLVSDTLITGNFVGTDATGTGALPNLGAGIEIDDSPFNMIGGTAGGEGNLVSGNIGPGILVHETGSISNTIQGNAIGTNAPRDAALPNRISGIFLRDVVNLTIGGSGEGEGNLIAGNGLHGIHIQGKASVSNVVIGNSIGTDEAGQLALGNGAHGLFLEQASNIHVGSDLAANLIAFNDGDGIRVEDGIENRLVYNSIFQNTGLAIDLNGDGVDSNDILDADGGANRSQNYPQLTLLDLSGGDIAIEGSLSSRPETGYTLYFYSSATCNPSGYGGGETLLGSMQVTTDVGGVAAFEAHISGTLAAGHVIAALAIDSAGNTSEFSACEEPAIFRDGFESGDLREWQVAENRGATAQVLPEAHYGGEYGLRLYTNGSATAWISDASPEDETDYRARLYGRFDELDLPEGERLTLLQTNSLDGTAHASLILEGTADGFGLLIEAREDNGTTRRSGVYPLAGGWRLLEIALHTEDGNGTLALLEGGTERSRLSGLSNGLARVDEVRLGVIATSAETTGYIQVDDFKSNRRLPIGGVACFPSVAFYDALPSWGNETNILNLIGTLTQTCR